MTFEDTIKKISATIAGLFIFLLASGMYLSFKGFVIGADGYPVLVKSAQAAETAVSNKIADNVNFIPPKNFVLGNKNAPVAIYEYSSLGCYHCADFHTDVLPKIKKEFIDTGKVKLVFSDFPLDKKSLQASMIARCVPEDKYYDFLTLLFKKQRTWSMSRKSEQVLIEYASLNGISKEKALSCAQDENVSKELIDIRAQAIERLGINGTPSILIVKGKDKELIPGAIDYASIKAILERKLEAK